jgi:glutamate dehydrogenase
VGHPLATEAQTHELPDSTENSERAAHIKIFAQRLFARLPAHLTESFSAERRLAIAAHAFEFFELRPDPIKVRVIAGTDGGGVITVETVMPDCPFIVASLLEYFHHKGAPVRMILHPLFNVARDAHGAIVSFEQSSSGERLESFTHAEIEAATATLDPAALETDIRRILDEVHLAASDFNAMTARALEICDETAATRELVEIREFLRWLVHGSFVFLGYRRYRVDSRGDVETLAVESGSGLGILRDESRSRYPSPVPLRALDEAYRKLLFDGSPLVIGKTHAESRVHRRAAMDDITVRRVGADGRVTAFDRFIGLFTSKAYAEEAQHIPVLRAKLAELLAAEHAQPGSHDYKEIVGVFNSFPKEELFRARLEELRSQLRLVLDRTEADVRLSLQIDPVRGNVIALVIMPREHFSAAVGMRIQEALAARLGGAVVYYYLALGDSYTARMHFCFAAPPPSPATVREMEADVVRLARTWDDLLRERLIERFGQARAYELAARWIPAFSPHYKTSCAVELALADIEQLESLFKDGGSFAVHVGAATDMPETSVLRMYEFGAAPILSELIPVLQNFGISVLSEEAYEFNFTGDGQAQRVFVQSFQVRSLKGEPLDKLAGAPLLGEALVAVRTERAEDDQLNALTLAAGLSWREVALLRAYLAAAFQMRLAPARLAMRRPVLLYTRLARILVDLFAARFNPDGETPAQTIADLKSAFLEQLAAVDNIADDRMARTLLAMVEATVRTNYFCDIPSPDPYIVLKFESAKIPNLPDTPPLYEIHVNSPRMEGCHLRAGRIARGGIRYSDRPDDYRTEILDLMKTQTIKNAIIVPVGSKGGFVVKSRAGRAPDRNAGVDAYQTLINAMLDLTDNVVGGKTVHPARVRILDDDGPYLVLAADKGTASFSDIANAIAERRAFWLGDAFASGGEHGYDHKKMGITARGAWESAKRHLREMGRDVERGVPITIVGIGDMSGDVFGNGLLYSRNVKLLAAFDHRDIFLDPNPDPAKSYDERKRLYDKPGSRWADYDPALISHGGGVFRRGLKQIPLSPEVRAALKCDANELDSDSLVQTILRAGVDMLYNGGIGTYVRASDETDAEVGDHANDPCRIVANELRAKIVVEGGNLGFTQKGRIEYALMGGRINADAIDNSAGVDMSDHEVNLKILLQPVVARGALSPNERNRRLAAAAEEVAASVLRDNRDQALMLSLEQVRSRTQTSAFRDHAAAIEQRGLLRRLERALPPSEELRERRSRYAGLTRPELAVLTAYTKIDLTERLESTPLVDDAYLVDRFLRPYFPPSIAAAFAEDIPRHGLRRELIATRMVNELVDLMGSTFIFNLVRDFGVEAQEAVRAWIIAAGVLDLHARADSLKANAAELTADAEMGAFFGLERAARRACGWALGYPDATAMPIADIVGRFKPAFEKLAGQFESMLAGGERDRFEQTYRELRAAVHQEQLAHELARLSFAGHLLNVLSLPRKIEAAEAARVYFGLSERLEFAMIEGAIDAISSDDRWERRAARDLSAELNWARTQLCCVLLDQATDGARPLAQRIALGRERRAAEVEQLMGDLRSLQSIGLPPLQVTVRALSRLASGT